MLGLIKEKQSHKKYNLIKLYKEKQNPYTLNL